MAWTGFASGLAGLFGGGISSAVAAKEAKKNRQFQERMSSTAYQRSMKDMRSAGLNPILAYQKGGASTPGGAQANIPDMGPAASTALSGVRLKQELRNMKDTQKQIRATTSKIEADEAASLTSAAKTWQNYRMDELGMPRRQLQQMGFSTALDAARGLKSQSTKTGNWLRDSMQFTNSPADSFRAWVNKYKDGNRKSK